MRIRPTSSGILGTNPSVTVGNIDLVMYSRNNMSQNNGSQGGSNQYGHQKFKKTYNSLICEFCKCKGHTKDTCFKLVGYPSDFKSKKGMIDRKTGQNQRYGAAYNAIGESSNMDLGPVNTQDCNVQQASMPYNMNGAGSVCGQGNNMGGYGSQNGRGDAQLQIGNAFTREQYDQIVQLLNKSHSVNSTVSSANVAGDVVGMVEDMALVATDNNSPEWIIDTGATNHMASDAKLLNQDTISEPVVPKRVRLPNGDITQVSHIGTSSISKNSTISNVFLVPKFKYNLLSVSKLTRELQCSAKFFPDFCVFHDFCVFQDLFTGRVKEIGREEGGLYLLLNQHTYNGKHVSLAVKNPEDAVCSQDINLWHKRLGLL